MQLTEHFSLAEMQHSDYAVRHGLDNTAPAAVVENLQQLAHTMELVRKACGDLPVVVHSGYRSPALNKLLKSTRTSAHISGLACDFHVLGMDLLDVARAIGAAGIEFDQLIYEGTWIHLGLAGKDRQPRGQTLRAVFRQGQKTQYPFWAVPA